MIGRPVVGDLIVEELAAKAAREDEENLPSMMWHPAVVDLIVAAALLVLGTSVGLFACRHFSGRPLFYQNEFGPAVMVAAGRGFVNPIATPGTPLAAFLNLQQPAITVADTTGVALGTVDQF